MQMADRIAEDGFQKAGYEYVCIDVSIWCARTNLFCHLFFFPTFVKSQVQCSR